jgi:hypothetical protein
MRLKQILIGSFLVCLSASVVSAQVPGVTYRRVLLPVVVETPVPGALGSLWKTDLGLTNDGSSAIWVYPIQFLGVLCEPVICASPNTHLPAGLTVPATIYYFGQGTPPTNGVILHAEDAYADSLRVSLRVHDLSRQDKSFGAIVPVVPENRFVPALSLLGLPGEDPNFRLNLRFYSLTTDTNVQVRVQAFATNPHQDVIDGVQDVLLGSQSFSLLPPSPGGSGPGSQPPGSAPSYLSIGDLKTITGGKTAPLYRLEISSATPGVTIWAFATITNNDTQEVTVIAPADH